MKPKTKRTVKIAPCHVTYKKGKKHIQVEITGSKLEDWIDKQVLQTTLHISDRTLQTLRTRRAIPYSRIGRKIVYYLPGILTLLEENMFH